MKKLIKLISTLKTTREILSQILLICIQAVLKMGMRISPCHIPCQNLQATCKDSCKWCELPQLCLSVPMDSASSFLEFWRCSRTHQFLHPETCLWYFVSILFWDVLAVACLSLCLPDIVDVWLDDHVCSMHCCEDLGRKAWGARLGIQPGQAWTESMSKVAKREVPRQDQDRQKEEMKAEF